eukprot:6214231-Pleurochrysis_carterae.AAC.5
MEIHAGRLAHLGRHEAALETAVAVGCVYELSRVQATRNGPKPRRGLAYFLRKQEEPVCTLHTAGSSACPTVVSKYRHFHVSACGYVLAYVFNDRGSVHVPPP